jgi:hypothetical protein
LDWCSSGIDIGLDRRTFMQSTGITALGAVGLASGGSGSTVGARTQEGTVPVEQSDIEREEVIDAVDLDLEHPRVFRQPSDVEVARRNVEETEWGAVIKDQIVELAGNMPLGSEKTKADYAYDFPVPEEWVPNRGTEHPRDVQTADEAGMWSFMDMDEEEISALQMYPEEDGQYRGLEREYHFAWPFQGWDTNTLENGVGCPIDGSELTLRGFDHPGDVMCVDHGHVFPETHDGVDVTDDGGGWVVPDDVPEDWAVVDTDVERIWFRAVYNGRIARVIRSSIPSIAYAYLLTEDEEYASKAALMLDLVGEPFANTGYMVNFSSKKRPGRMHRTGYAVDTLVNRMIDAADVTWNSGKLDVESPTVPGMTIKENVAYNIVADSAYFMWDSMHSGVDPDLYDRTNYARIFHNGTDRHNRTLMVASSFAGLDVGFVEWVLEGQVSLSNFLSNTVFRDGQYFEMSAQYAQSFRQTAETAHHLRDHPKYPDGRNYFDESRYELLNVFGPIRNKVAGRDVVFGDGPPDFSVRPDPEVGNFSLLLRFYRYASDEEKREEYAQLLAEAYGQDPNESLKPQEQIQYWDVEGAVWPLFNIENEITGFDLDELAFEPRSSELLPGRGFAYLRPDEDRFDQGAAMWYGPPLSKAHSDSLGLHIYGAGREMSYDPGHRPRGDQRGGFLRQTVAHNTVVVNEWSQSTPETAGGVVNAFANRDGYSLADVSNDMAYHHVGVDEYRRSTGFVDTPLGQSYMVDLFRVAGGQQHDFSFHGLGAEFATDLDLSEPADGSVATSDNRWDEMEENGGDVTGPGADEEPPGNGYGWLAHPRTADGDQQWSATWSVREDQSEVAGDRPGKMRLTMVPAEDREVVVADGPEVLSYNLGIDPDDRIGYVLARENGEEPTQYISVIEAVEDEFVVDSVEKLDVRSRGSDARFEPVALKAELADGETVDYFLSTLGDDQFTAKTDASNKLSTDADFAMVRVDDDGIDTVRIEGGTHFHAKLPGSRSVVIQASRRSDVGDDGVYSGEIVGIDYEDSSIVVDGAFPDGSQLRDTYALVDAPEYTRNSQYEVDHVETDGDRSRVHLMNTDMQLARGTVEAVEDGNVVLSPTRFPFLRNWALYTDGKYDVENTGNTYFDGRLTAVNLDTGAQTTVTNAHGDYRRLTLGDANGFSKGDTFALYDIKTGDEVEVPLSAELRESADGSYDVDAPDDVVVNRH